MPPHGLSRNFHATSPPPGFVVPQSPRILLFPSFPRGLARIFWAGNFRNLGNIEGFGKADCRAIKLIDLRSTGKTRPNRRGNRQARDRDQQPVLRFPQRFGEILEQTVYHVRSLECGRPRRFALGLRRFVKLQYGNFFNQLRKTNL